MVAGGTLIANEDEISCSFICESTVFNNGQTLASSVYFYRIVAESPGRTDKFVQVKKLVLIK